MSHSATLINGGWPAAHRRRIGASRTRGLRRPRDVNTILLRCWAAAGLAGALALGLCGCGGAGAKPADMPASPMPTSSLSAGPPAPSPTPARTGPLTTGPGVLPGEKPPVEPAIATNYTRDGAYAFAIYFVRVVDWSIATTDPALIPALSERSCQACQRYVDGLTEIRQRNERQVGGRITILASAEGRGIYRTRADFAFVFDLAETPRRLVPANSPAPEQRTTRPGTPYKSIVFVSWNDEGWKVVEQGAP